MFDLTRPLDLWTLILPEEGWKCLAIKTPGGMRHEWFVNLTEMESRALALAEKSDVYHACASFRERGSRKSDNALGASALWLDVDCSPTREYSDLRTAWAAANSFCQSVKLPIPITVASGGGLHLYWPCERLLPRDEWERAARGLKRLCASEGFHADPARTADISSILRPPGTRNHKYDPPVLVQGGYGGGMLDGGQLSRLANHEDDGRLSPAKQPLADQLTLAASTVHNHEPSYASLIVDRCAQLAYLRDSKGNLPEPEWYAALGLLAYCEDGDALAHAWSAGYPGYTIAETTSKMVHARRATSGPTTCAGFESRFAARCAGCPIRGTISSPIQLGRSQTPPVALPAETELPRLPSPFRWKDTKLVVTVKNADDTEKEIEVYKAPIVVDGYRVGEAGEDRSVAIRHLHAVEGWKHELIKWDSLDLKTVMNRLMAVGIQVYPIAHKWMLDYLMKSVDLIEAKRATEVEYNQFGWKGDFDAFLLGRDLYVPDADATPVGVGGEAAQRADMMKPRGSYAEWRRAVSRLFAKGAEGQAFILVASFAAPLMKFRLDHGGVIVSAISHATGTGKTTALEAAASVWGELNAVNLNTNDTQNSRFRELAVLSNLPIVFDELREKDPSVIKSFVLSFTEGRDKNRVSREGKLQALTRGWSTIILSASNISLAETVTSDNEIAQAARILEYEAELPEGLKSADGDLMKKVLRANRGHAGREFLDNLVRPECIAWLHQRLEQYDREYAVKLGGGTDTRFYSALLACVKAAGQLLVQWDMLEFDPERIAEFGLQKALGMKKQLKDAVQTPAEILLSYINETWPDCLVMEDAHKPTVTPIILSLPLRGKLHMRYEKKPGRLLIDKKHLRSWCLKQNQIFSVLEQKLSLKHVVLETDLSRQLGAGTTYRAEGQTRCWLVNCQHEEMRDVRQVVYAIEPNDVVQMANRKAEPKAKAEKLGPVLWKDPEGKLPPVRG